MVAPIEQPMATFFFSGVPSMGCQWATSSRCGSRAAVVLCGHVISDDPCRCLPNS